HAFSVEEVLDLDVWWPAILGYWPSVRGRSICSASRLTNLDTGWRGQHELAGTIHKHGGELCAHCFQRRWLDRCGQGGCGECVLPAATYASYERVLVGRIHRHDSCRRFSPDR